MKSNSRSIDSKEEQRFKMLEIEKKESEESSTLETQQTPLYNVSIKGGRDKRDGLMNK